MEIVAEEDHQGIPCCRNSEEHRHHEEKKLAAKEDHQGNPVAVTPDLDKKGKPTTTAETKKKKKPENGKEDRTTTAGTFKQGANQPSWDLVPSTLFLNKHPGIINKLLNGTYRGPTTID